MADDTNEELVRRITAIETALSAIEARDRPELVTESYLRLPQLRGYWPLNTHQAGGDANDQSKSGLTVFLLDDTFYANVDWLTYAQFDGANDFFNRPDEAALDILGTEAYVAAANRGLTLGGWFYVTSQPQPSTGLIAKWLTTGNQRAYGIMLDTVANAQIKFNISTDGINTVSAQSPVGSLVTGAWLFCVGRFTPSAELKLWVNEDTYTTVAGVPASIFNSTAFFAIASHASPVYPLTGRAAYCFLCAGILSDNVVEDLFERTRWLFSV